MSVHISAQVWDLDLPTSSKIILLKLADCADREGGNAWPSVATICRETGLGERTVRSCLKEMTASGVLEITKEATQHRPRTYRVVPSRGAKIATDSGEAVATGAPEVQAEWQNLPSRGATAAPDPSLTVLDPSLEPPDDPSGALALSQAAKEMSGMLQTKLGPWAYDVTTVEECDLFGRDFAGQWGLVNELIEAVRRDGGKLFPNNLRRKHRALQEAAQPAYAERAPLPTALTTPQDAVLSLRARDLIEEDRVLRGDEERPLLRWEDAVAMAKAEAAR